MSESPILNLLEKFCHINDITRTPQRKSAGEAVLAHPERTLVSGARLGYVLIAFQRLVRGEIDEETFFGTGEVWGTEAVVMPARGNEVYGWLHIQEQLQTPAYPVSLLVVDDAIHLIDPQSEALLKQAEDKGMVVVYIS